MLGTAILYLLYATIFLFTLPIRVFPDVTLNPNFASAIATLQSYIAMLVAVIPVATLLEIFVLYIAFENAHLALKLVNWVIKKIPFIN